MVSIETNKFSSKSFILGHRAWQIWVKRQQKRIDGRHFYNEFFFLNVVKIALSKVSFTITSYKIKREDSRETPTICS